MQIQALKVMSLLAGMAALGPVAISSSWAQGASAAVAAAKAAPASSAAGSRAQTRSEATLPRRNPLQVDKDIAVRQEPQKALDLPGVMKLEGAEADLLDPTRSRTVSCRNRGAVTVWISDHQVNRIQLPFENPRVVATDALSIDKRVASNNVYVHYERTPTAEQIWFEPPGQSSLSCGLQLVPKDIPAQDIVVLDDTVDSTATRAQRAGAQNEYLTRVQALMEQAGLGASPSGFSESDLQAPPMAVNGLSVRALRRLSSRTEDLYVYELGNPAKQSREIREEEFDGTDVLAVSILPKPVLQSGERAILVVLAKKREVRG